MESIKKISYLPFALLFMQFFAFGQSLPWGLLPFEAGRWIWQLFSILFLGLLWKFDREVSTRFFGLLEKRLVLSLWVLLNLIYLGFSYFKYRDLGFRFPWWGLAVVFLGAFTADSKRKFKPIVFNLAFFVSSLLDFPVDVFRSDMIPAVQQALKSWAESGNPYLLGQNQGAPVKYGYLPGIFISYLPAWFLGIDLRWNNFLYRLLWLVFLNQIVMKSKKKEAVLAFQYLAYSPYLNFRHDLYFEGFILLLVSYFRFPSFRFNTLPLMTVTSQWSWVLAPFLLLKDWFENPTAQAKIALKYIFAGVLTLAFVGFVLWDRASWPEMFKTIFWFQNVVGDSKFPYDYGLNFKFFFLKLGILNWMQKVQFLGLVIVFIFSLRTKESRKHILEWGLVSLILFIMLNGHFWLYFWNAAIVFSIIVISQMGKKA